MIRYLKIILILITILPLSLQAAKFSSALTAGYNGGPGLYLNAELSDFANQFPFKLRMGAGYTMFNNPGKALDARHVFINNNSNGSPDKKGWLYDFRLDLLYQVGLLGLPNAYVYGGPRYAMFTGNFNFVDGNEDFDVVSNHWGWGLGIANYFRINNSFDLLIDAGSDYFISSILKGHDTSYSPDNENVNPREDYSYDDADEAINQPKFNLRLMMGLNYHF